MYRLAAFSWGAKLLTALFNFASIVLLSQLLGEADRGVCALYALIIALILLLADMAGGATVVYLMQQFSRKALRNIYLQWAAAVALLAGGAAGCLAQLSATETILLMAAGYDVTEAGNAELALKLMGEGKSFDVIVSDIGMPGMDGRQFAAAVKGDPGWRATPVVGLAADSDGSDPGVFDALTDRTGCARVLDPPIAVADPSSWYMLPPQQ